MRVFQPLEALELSKTAKNRRPGDHRSPHWPEDVQNLSIGGANDCAGSAIILRPCVYRRLASRPCDIVQRGKRRDQYGYRKLEPERRKLPKLAQPHFPWFHGGGCKLAWLTHLNQKAEELFESADHLVCGKTFGPNIRNRFTALLPSALSPHMTNTRKSQRAIADFLPPVQTR